MITTMEFKITSTQVPAVLTRVDTAARRGQDVPEV